MDQQLIGFHLAMTKGPVEGLDYQDGIHPLIQRPTDDAAAEQIDPDSEIPPAGRRADVSDIAGPAAVGCWGLKVLLQQVLRHPNGASAGPGAGPERLACSGSELSTAHQPGHAMAADVAPRGPQLLMDPRRSVEAAMLLKHRRDLSGDRRVLGRSLSRRLLPLPPGVKAATGHAQLPAQPGHRVAACELVDQAKPLGGNCSLHLRGAAEWAGGHSALPPA